MHIHVCICIYIHLYAYTSMYMHSHYNKAIEDTRLHPVLPPGVSLSKWPIYITFAWPITGKWHHPQNHNDRVARCWLVSDVALRQHLHSIRCHLLHAPRYQLSIFSRWAFVVTRLSVSNSLEYIGWSDITYLWPQCDRHVVGQHVVPCVVKWWRFVALFESNWISWFKKMSVLSLSYWESDVYWRQNNKHFAELALQNGGKQLIWRNYVTVTLCIPPSVSPSVLWHYWLGIQPVENWVMRYWHSYLYAARYKSFAYGPANVTATPSSLASFRVLAQM